MSSTSRGMYWGESGVSLQDSTTLRLGLVYPHPVHFQHPDRLGLQWVLCVHTLMDCKHL